MDAHIVVVVDITYIVVVDIIVIVLGVDGLYTATVLGEEPKGFLCHMNYDKCHSFSSHSHIHRNSSTFENTHSSLSS